MKRDKNLWLLILRERAGGSQSPELANYSQAEKVYNSALLVQGGYVDGSVIENGSGIAASVVMLQMTNAGHDLLESLEADQRSVNQPNPPMRQKPLGKLSVFISHSAKDEKLASCLVMLLRNALNIPAEKIRCTSVNGYRLPIGTDTEEQLRNEVQDATAFIGLITPSSIASAYVMFELGARWGAKLHLAPLLGAGADVNFLRGPLSSLNALNCEDSSQVHQLISDLSKLLEIQAPTSPAAYQTSLDDLVRASTPSPPSQDNLTVAPMLSEEKSLLNAFGTVLNSDTLPELGEGEAEILRLFIRDREYGLSKESVAEQAKIHVLKADQILEHLGKMGLLFESRRVGLGGHYKLASKGRDYLIANKLL